MAIATAVARLSAAGGRMAPNGALTAAATQLTSSIAAGWHQKGCRLMGAKKDLSRPHHVASTPRLISRRPERRDQPRVFAEGGGLSVCAECLSVVFMSVSLSKRRDQPSQSVRGGGR